MKSTRSSRRQLRHQAAAPAGDSKHSSFETNSNTAKIAGSTDCVSVSQLPPAGSNHLISHPSLFEPALVDTNCRGKCVVVPSADSGEGPGVADLERRVGDDKDPPAARISAFMRLSGIQLACKGSSGAVSRHQMDGTTSQQNKAPPRAVPPLNLSSTAAGTAQPLSSARTRESQQAGKSERRRRRSTSAFMPRVAVPVTARSSRAEPALVRDVASNPKQKVDVEGSKAALFVGQRGQRNLLICKIVPKA